MQKWMTRIEELGLEPSLLSRFKEVWPLAERIFEAFASSSGIPIFVFLENKCLFQTSLDTMPSFCSAMLSSDVTRDLCFQDALHRVSLQEPLSPSGEQLCHAGLLNGRRVVQIPPIGELIVLYGSRRSQDSDQTLKRQQALLAKIGEADVPSLLRAHSEIKDGIRVQDRQLIDAIGVAIETLFRESVEFHWLAVNMAHELSIMLLGTGLASMELVDQLELVQEGDARQLAELKEVLETVSADSQLGLYICRNFLSYVSETRYREAVEIRSTNVDMERLVRDLVALYRRVAALKGIKIEIKEPLSVPNFRGFGTELRRAFHNVLANAVKYSYHSNSRAGRSVRIWCRNPYDPGFKARRWSIVVQNYGLGLDEHEQSRVGKAGFRGRQAVEEVPIGAGIGLAEVNKILRVHRGELKFRSHEAHRDETGRPTYLTEVELIFPFTHS
jgi:signal transduction histidine kinase